MIHKILSIVKDYFKVWWAVEINRNSQNSFGITKNIVTLPKAIIHMVVGADHRVYWELYWLKSSKFKILMYFRFNIQKFKILLLPIILEKRHIIELLIHAGIFLQSYLFKEVIFIISQKLVLSKPWLNGKEHVRKLALGSCYLKHCLV